LDESKVRLGPGTDYATLLRIPKGAAVSIVADPAGVNGVLAKGSTWWKISYEDVVGWVQDDVLANPPSRDRTLESLMERLADLAIH
jgi:uncharacterized protein YraI